MVHPNRLVDKIRSLSPSWQLLAAKPIEELTEIVTIYFETGQSGFLDMKNRRAVHWARTIDRLRRANRPVYVEIDPETNIITNLLIPRIWKVRSLVPDEKGDIIVDLPPSAAVHYLLQSHPNFEEILGTLQSALDENANVLVTETREEFEIIDVKKLPQEPGEPHSPPPEPTPDPAVSEQRARDLFNDMNAESCDPCNPSSDCIPFKYPNDGCWLRAHKMCYYMNQQGEDPEKVWIEWVRNGLPSQWVDTSNSPECKVRWRYHVAPTLTVSTAAGNVRWVIDPSLFNNPVPVDEWKNRQDPNFPTADLRFTSWTDYFDGQTDPDCTITDSLLPGYRDDLQDRCDLIGPPPYSCPIVEECFFIVDRNTFSEHEIEAMLHEASPAVIEAAFYIVVDGFRPDEFGITPATLSDPPNKYPDLVITPNVPEMSIEPVHLGLQYPSYLNRRQRLTWVYRIKFTGTSAFVNLPLAVTLSASISTVSGSSTVSSSAMIYLIEQPNPFEVDGETSWLSTDLRVFQIKEGESKFGVKMNTNPSAFITQVINNLNSGNTGGQTFENNIPTDPQASRLELSEKVNGISVYNFAVGKVRYRSLGVPANYVRLFFRLIPYTSTSVQYNLATTYRRGGQAGVVIPLLGIQNGEVSSFPCFAAQRIDTSQANMNSQTDPENVQTIPYDASGAEVVRYFGCWLDINQPNQPQFPIQPTPTDGPFPSQRKTIQELIRNKHQCLVSEIAFDPAPIPSGVSPSSSDKLAQRNLSIVESANPGIVASRRIPNTFDIQLSESKLEPDELMIDWGNTPIGSLATIYLPDVSTDDILSLAVEKYRSHSLIRVDDHTLQCLTGGITYVPIPMKYGPGIIGMLTVDLPPTVERGQVFTIVVRQVAGERMISRPSTLAAMDISSQVKWRHILGSYQITIPVKAKEAILEPEERLLSNFRWIEKAIPADNRWFKVFSRYVKQTAARVDALGGDSSKVLPSPSGDWKKEYRKCTGLALVIALLLATIVVRYGMLTGGLLMYIDLPLYALLVSVGYYWIRNCRPQRCSLLRVLMGGSGSGAVILILYAMFGTYTTQLFRILVLSIVITVVAAVEAWRRNCF